MKKKILVFGGSGLVGSKFIELYLYSQDLEISAPDASSVDILDKDHVLKAVEQFNPDALINFAAFTNVEEAEMQKDDQAGICYLLNAMGAKNVAEAAYAFNKHLIHISTDYVFDGTKEESPYTEKDKPNPLNWYGKTKYFGEQLILESSCHSTIVRISMPFRSCFELKKDIARFSLGELQKGNKIKAVQDQRVTPTLVDDISHALKLIIQSSSLGLYHVSSIDSVTPLEFIKTIAEVFKLDYSLIESVSLIEYQRSKKAKMPKFSWLNPTKFEEEFGEGLLHTVEEGLTIFKKEIDEQAKNQI